MLLCFYSRTMAEDPGSSEPLQGPPTEQRGPPLQRLWRSGPPGKTGPKRDCPHASFSRVVAPRLEPRCRLSRQRTPGGATAWPSRLRREGRPGAEGSYAPRIGAASEAGPLPLVSALLLFPLLLLLPLLLAFLVLFLLPPPLSSSCFCSSSSSSPSCSSFCLSSSLPSFCSSSSSSSSSFCSSFLIGNGTCTSSRRAGRRGGGEQLRHKTPRCRPSLQRRSRPRRSPVTSTRGAPASPFRPAPPPSRPSSSCRPSSAGTATSVGAEGCFLGT